MSNRDNGDFPIDPFTVSGTELAERLGRMVSALDTANSGTVRPTYATQGTWWLDIATANEGKVYMFDGTHDVLIGTINLSTGEIAIEGAGGGAKGGGDDEIFYENDMNVTTDYTLTAGKNAMSAGEITVDGGVTVTVPVGATWTVV